MSKRNLYLKTIPVDEAVEKYTKAVRELIGVKREEIPVTESLGRVTARAVYARFCSPLFNAAAMDGVAVVSDEATLWEPPRKPRKFFSSTGTTGLWIQEIRFLNPMML